MPKLRTRLVDTRSLRRDDREVVALILELSRSARPRRPVVSAGLLNEQGELYREVRLYGEYEVLQFTARMNACGFVRVEPAHPHASLGYESVFAKP